MTAAKRAQCLHPRENIGVFAQEHPRRSRCGEKATCETNEEIDVKWRSISISDAQPGHSWRRVNIDLLAKWPATNLLN
jgi:hypothetical protein